MSFDQQILAEKLRLLGPDSLETIHTMDNLAVDHYDLQAYDESLAILEQVVGARKQKLGDNHPDTILSLWNRGLTLQKQEK